MKRALMFLLVMSIAAVRPSLAENCQKWATPYCNAITDPDCVGFGLCLGMTYPNSYPVPECTCSTSYSYGPECKDGYTTNCHCNITRCPGTAVFDAANCQCLPAPSITATPSLVLIPYPDACGTTSIAWNAPGHSPVFIYVSANGRAPTPMASGGSTGTVSVPWMCVGSSAKFILYPAKTDGTVDLTTTLTSVTATAQQLPSPTITATPNPVRVPIGSTCGTTNIAWNAPGRSAVYLYVSANGKAPTPMAYGGSTGTASAPWMCVGDSAKFIVYPAKADGTADTATTLTSITVTSSH